MYILFESERVRVYSYTPKKGVKTKHTTTAHN